MSLISVKRRKLLAVFVAAALLLSMIGCILSTSAQAVSQSDVDALKEKQDELAGEKDSIEQKLDALKNETDSQTEQLSLLTEQLSVTNSELENLSEQITAYTGSIAEMENELNEDKQKEQELLVLYKKRMRAMEENGNYTYYLFIFGADSLDDLLSRIDCVLEILQYNDDLIRDVQNAAATVNTAKTNMENEMTSMQEVLGEYQAKQTDLLTQQEEVQAVLDSLSTSSEDYNEQLSTVTTLQSSLQSQISDMEDKLAEQERIKAEEQAASKLESSSSATSSSSSTPSSSPVPSSSSSTPSSSSSSSSSSSEGTAAGAEIVAYAETFLGVPYVYGGTSPSGFDCSGLVYYCYRHFGYSVNRTASGLAYNGVSVSSSNLQPGDVLLFTSASGGYIGHTGIYIGGGQFIHAPHTGDVVKISSLSETYYSQHYWGARRIVGN